MQICSSIPNFMEGLVTGTKELYNSTRDYSWQVKGDSASKIKINSGL